MLRIYVCSWIVPMAAGLSTRLPASRHVTFASPMHPVERCYALDQGLRGGGTPLIEGAESHVINLFSLCMRLVADYEAIFMKKRPSIRKILSYKKRRPGKITIMAKALETVQQYTRSPSKKDQHDYLYIISDCTHGSWTIHKTFCQETCNFSSLMPPVERCYA